MTGEGAPWSKRAIPSLRWEAPELSQWAANPPVQPCSQVGFVFVFVFFNRVASHLSIQSVLSCTAKKITKPKLEAQEYLHSHVVRSGYVFSQIGVCNSDKSGQINNDMYSKIKGEVIQVSKYRDQD